MITIYQYVDSKNSELVGAFDTQCEFEALKQFRSKLQANNHTITSHKILGESRGVVYRLDFEMNVDGEKNAYHLLQC